MGGGGATTNYRIYRIYENIKQMLLLSRDKSRVQREAYVRCTVISFICKLHVLQSQFVAVTLYRKHDEQYNNSTALK